MALLDRCIWLPAQDGAGDFQESNAVTGYQTMESAGAVDGQTYSYAAQTLNSAGAITAWEVGQGAWTLATRTLARTTVLYSSTGSKINFTSPPQVMITALAEDLSSGNTYYVGTGQSLTTIAQVNAKSFEPGDSILFQGGQTFSGAIVCPSAGTPAKPITFGSYGGGQATISSGSGTGFSSTNQAGIIVRDLTFTGSASSNTGIYFNNALSGNVHLQNIQVINCNVSGYGFSGIFVTGTNGTAGYDDVLIEGCVVSSCCNSTGSVVGSSGIQVISAAGYGLNVNPPSFYNIVIAGCFSSSNPGVSDTVVTGYGISVGQTKNGRIEGCVTNGNGANGTTASMGGPLGVLARDSSNVLIVGCISYGNLSPTANDAGGGFDLDGGCYYCTIKDCYSYGNFGPGYLIFANSALTNTLANDHNSIINCVSENDGGGSGSLAHASLAVENYGTITNLKVYGCSFYQSEAGTDTIYIYGTNNGSVTGIIASNTLITSSTQPFISCSAAPSITIEGNSYFSGSKQFNATWNNKAYTDKNSFIAASSQETYLAIGPTRQTLTGNQSFYVNNSTGSNSNPGTISLPFATLQFAWNYVSGSLDLGGTFIITINLAASATAYTLTAVSGFVTGSNVNIIGAGSATTTIDSLTISGGFPLGCSINVDNVTLVGTTGGTCVSHQGSGQVNIGLGGSGDIVIGNGATSGLTVSGVSGVLILFAATITNTNAADLFLASSGILVFVPTGAIQWSGAGWTYTNTARVTLRGTIQFVFGSFTGTPAVTAKRFVVDTNSIITGTGGNISFFPGSSAGTAATGGQYT